LPSNPTNTPKTPATPTKQLGLTKNWTVKTGDIQYIGVASDGTVYGVGPNLYAIISKDGEVLQTNEIDLTDCLRDNFSGGSGDTEIDRWFVAKPNGTLVTATPCVISPGNPPTVKIIRDGHYFPYADDNIFLETPTTPDGFTNDFGATYLFFSRLNDFNFFFNAQQKTFGFVDHNGGIRYFTLPDEVDMGRYRGGGIQIAITPWDDVYYSYPTFDSLGNELGQKIVKVESDGTSKVIDRFPYVDTSTNYISDLTRMRPIYLPEQKELYFYQKTSLVVYDLDFNYLREYPLPSDFPKITYGVADSTEKLFVGHDGAVYVFDTGITAKTLTKYLLPDQNVQTESQPTAVISNDNGLLSQILSRGTIVIATDPNYYPQSELNFSGERSKDSKCESDQLTAGELLGFDVDVAIAIGSRLGVEPCFVAPQWTLITAGTWGNEWDISVGSMEITSEREQVLFFMTPYYYNEDGSPMGIAIDKASSLSVENLVKVVDQIVNNMHMDGTLSEFSYKWFGKDLTK